MGTCKIPFLSSATVATCSHFEVYMVCAQEQGLGHRSRARQPRSPDCTSQAPWQPPGRQGGEQYSTYAHARSCAYVCLCVCARARACNLQAPRQLPYVHICLPPPFVAVW
eukprot:583845-Pelagomonas_calceolata.AAC.5